MYRFPVTWLLILAIINLSPLGQAKTSTDVPKLNAGLADTLQDPAGKPHHRLAVDGKIGVVIFSVPDMSQGPSQRRWSRILASDPSSRLPDSVALVLVENMALSGPFRDEARDDMQKQFTAKKRPFLLLDESGNVSKRFGILRDRTEVLIFDQKGQLRDVEDNLDNRDQVEARIKSVVAGLNAKSR